MKKFLLIEPRNCKEHIEQLGDCLDRLDGLLKESGLERRNILRNTVFVNVRDFNEFTAIKADFSDVFSGFFKGAFPPVSIIPQPPLNSGVCLEVMAADENPGVNIEYCEYNSVRYSKAQYPDRTEIISGEICSGAPGLTIIHQADYAMRTAGELLKNEGFTYSDIVRQWNYVGSICDCTVSDGIASQNYQVFNDVRSAYYSTSSWLHGYPSSTGIGISLERIIVDFAALRPKTGLSIIPLRNPRQTDAHSYTGDVLHGSPNAGFEQTTTPKFERGKAIKYKDQAEIYISGTAAILGQNSADSENAAAQTKITIGNILEIVSRKNLEFHGLWDAGKTPRFDYFRVYIKNPEDYAAVRNEFRNYFPGIAVAYLVADICRTELLVEIEAYMSL